MTPAGLDRSTETDPGAYSYNPVGSTAHARFNMSRTHRWQTDPRALPRELDSDWEGELWVPAVDTLGTLGRWAFAELTEIYQIESDFEAKVERAFDEMIARARRVRSGTSGHPVRERHRSPSPGRGRPGRASPPALSA